MSTDHDAAFASEIPSDDEGPYPLLRRFLTLVLPILLVGALGLIVASAAALATIVERAYEAEATRRHSLVLTSAASLDPVAFAALSRGERPTDEQRAALADMLAREARAYGLSCIGIGAPDASELIAEGPDCPNASPEQISALQRNVQRQLAAPSDSLFREISDPIPAWMVVSVPQDRDGKRAVVATFRESGPLEGVITTTTVAWVGGLALVLVAATGFALALIVRAQREIDRRTTALKEARHALARFVSNHVRAGVRVDDIARRTETSVLFMDIRDFSGFADVSPPETAAALVRDIARIGFSAVLSHGGDVDRLIGDGLVARFDGPGRCASAYAAAEEIVRRVAAAHTARAVGIGLMDGIVVEATIAAGDRADATILGRTVNLGARLCSAAGPGEIVAAESMPCPTSPSLVEIGTEALTLKGHRAPFRARRYTLAPETAA